MNDHNIIATMDSNKPGYESLWSFSLPEKVHQIQAVYDNHICVAMGTVMQIYEINQWRWSLVAQISVSKSR